MAFVALSGVSLAFGDRDILQDYLKQEEVAAVMYKFMDQESAMKKALRTERQEGRQEGRQETSDLMNYLWSHGRGEDALNASRDQSLMEKLLTEFRTLSLVN